MNESCVDLSELEKLRPNTNVKEPSKGQKKESEKWQLLLEPVLIGSMLAISLGQTSLQNFYLRTACTVDLGLDPSICDKGVGKEFEAAEAQSQAVLSSVNISRSFVGSLISTIVLLFVGPWSDCSGRRKPLVMLPLIGMIAMSTGALLMLTFPGANTVQALYTIQIPMSLGGNFGLLLAAAFSHIGDVCHTTGRDVTRNMGTHRAAVQASHVLGAVGGPLCFRWLGFYGVFTITLSLQVSSLLYVIFFMKDVNINDENKVSVCNWRLPFNAISCLVKRREGHKRAIIFLMLIVTLGDRMILSADVYYAYMYYRLKFQWTDILFGIFLAYRNIFSLFGTLLILTVLKRRLKLSDVIVGAFSSVSFLLANSGLIATSSTIVVFVLPIVGIISQGSQVVQRPVVNKQILPTEQGKIYSVLGALESATQTITTPLYSLLYSRTVSTMPDAWLFPGLVVTVVQFSAFLLTRKLEILTRKAPKDHVEINKQQIVAKEKQALPVELKTEINMNSSPINVVDKKNANINL